MLSGSRVVPVEEIRAAVRAAVEASTVRAIAAEIGIPYATLNLFVHGSKPYARTLQKLRAWHATSPDTELLRLREEVADLRKRLADCERERRKGK